MLVADDAGCRIVDDEANGSTVGKMPLENTARESSVVASRCAKVVAGAGSV